MNRFVKVFFYGNIYLGIYAVALCIETNLINNISLNNFPFYLVIFLCTCIYYTMIYVRSVGAKIYNERTIWYRKNLELIKKFLRAALVLAFAFVAYFLLKNAGAFSLLSPGQLLIIFLVPAIAAWYTFSLGRLGLKKIREVGWIKPFIVGLTWAGWVTIYPLVVWQIQNKIDASYLIGNCTLLWSQNFLFCSINAIIFDLKDYRNDLQLNLKTYPVILGIRDTLKFIIIPVLILNLVLFFLFQNQNKFSPAQSAIQLIPYVLLILTIAKYRHRKSVLYYLVAVDGLVFVKALCGIASILFFKK